MTSLPIKVIFQVSPTWPDTPRTGAGFLPRRDSASCVANHRDTDKVRTKVTLQRRERLGAPRRGRESSGGDSGKWWRSADPSGEAPMTRQRWRRTQLRRLRSLVRMNVWRKRRAHRGADDRRREGVDPGPNKMNPAPPAASEVRIRLPRFPSERTASSTIQQRPALAKPGATATIAGPRQRRRRRPEASRRPGGIRRERPGASGYPTGIGHGPTGERSGTMRSFSL